MKSRGRNSRCKHLHRQHSHALTFDSRGRAARWYGSSTASPASGKRPPDLVLGGLHGSSYINQGFRQTLEGLLRNESYLNTEDSSIKGCIEKIIVNDFEYKVKRSFDIYTARGFKQFDVPGLRANPAKRFSPGSLALPV